MALQIFHNISSLNAQRVLALNNSRLGKSISRIASGSRILEGSDDAAGLTLSETLRSDTRALRQAVRNGNDGIALVNVAEGALNEISTIAITLREIAGQSTSATIGNSVRETLQLQFDQFTTEIDRIGNTTEFNGQKLIDGSLSASSIDQVVLQIGLDSTSVSRLNINQEADLKDSRATALGLSGLSISTQGDAFDALDTIEDAVTTLGKTRANLGSFQNRLSISLLSLGSTVEHLTAADSTIRDADLAEELTALTRNQILVQTSSAMVSQANLTPRGVLSLLELQ